jgi:hypothetical protein
MSTVIRREYFEFNIYLRASDGPIKTAKILQAIRNDGLPDILDQLKNPRTGYGHTTEQLDEAVRIYGIIDSHKLEHHSGFNVEETIDGRPTDNCSWMNIYSYLKWKKLI